MFEVQQSLNLEAKEISITNIEAELDHSSKSGIYRIKSEIQNHNRINFEVNKDSTLLFPRDQPLPINEIEVNDSSLFFVHLTSSCSVLLNNSYFSLINGRLYRLIDNRDSISSFKISLVDVQQSSFLSYETNYSVPTFIEINEEKQEYGFHSVGFSNREGPGRLIISDCLFSRSKYAFRSESVSSTQIIRCQFEMIWRPIQVFYGCLLLLDTKFLSGSNYVFTSKCSSTIRGCTFLNAIELTLSVDAFSSSVLSGCSFVNIDEGLDFRHCASILVLDSNFEGQNRKDSFSIFTSNTLNFTFIRNRLLNLSNGLYLVKTKAELLKTTSTNISDCVLICSQSILFISNSTFERCTVLIILTNTSSLKTDQVLITGGSEKSIGFVFAPFCQFEAKKLQFEQFRGTKLSTSEKFAIEFDLIDSFQIDTKRVSEPLCSNCCSESVSTPSHCGHLPFCRTCSVKKVMKFCSVCNCNQLPPSSKSDKLSDESDSLCCWCFSRRANCGVLSIHYHACHTCLGQFLPFRSNTNWREANASYSSDVSSVTSLPKEILEFLSEATSTK